MKSSWTGPRVRKWAGEELETILVEPDSTELTALESHTPILCNGDTSTVMILALLAEHRHIQGQDRIHKLLEQLYIKYFDIC